METELEVIENHLLNLVEKLAAAEGYQGKWSELWHEIEECNLLEQKQEEWQAFLRELLENSRELRDAVRAQLEAHALLSEMAARASTALEIALKKRNLPLLGSTPPSLK